MKRPAIGAWVVFVVLGGCALDYDKDQTPEADQIPVMVFEKLHQTGIKDGRILYTMESEHSQVFHKTKQMRLKQFRFEEYDSAGESVSVGEAETAVIDTSSNDAQITGRLRVRSSERRVTLEVNGGSAGGLTWANEDRILKTQPNTTVRLEKDDGSVIEARSLTLDLGSNRMELEDGVQGTWTPETNDDAKAPPAPPVDLDADAPH